MNIYLRQFVDYLLNQSWQIAILAMVVALLVFLLRNKSAHVRYLLWLIVLAKCLVPPLYGVPLRVLPEDTMGVCAYLECNLPGFQVHRRMHVVVIYPCSL